MTERNSVLKLNNSDFGLILIKPNTMKQLEKTRKEMKEYGNILEPDYNYVIKWLLYEHEELKRCIEIGSINDD